MHLQEMENKEMGATVYRYCRLVNVECLIANSDSLLIAGCARDMLELALW